MNTALLLLADGRFPAGGHAHSGGAEAAVKAGRIHDAATMTAFLTGRLHTAGLTAAALAAAACRACAEPGRSAGPPDPFDLPVPLDPPGPPDPLGRLELFGPPGPDGSDGSNGSDGSDGSNGSNGSNGSVEVIDTVARLDPVDPPALVGPDGPAGTGGPVDVIDLLGRLDEAADARTPSPALRTVGRRLGRQLLRAARAAWPHPVLDRLAERYPGGAHHPVVLGATAYAAGLTPAQAALTAAYESVNGPATACVRLLGLDPYQVASALAGLAPQVDAVAAEATRAAAQHELPAASAPLLDIYAEQHSTWKVRLFAS